MATAVAAALAAAMPRCFINFPDEDPEGLPGLGGGVTEASPGAAVTDCCSRSGDSRACNSEDKKKEIECFQLQKYSLKKSYKRIFQC